MKNTFKFLGIIVFAAVIVFAMVGCGGDDGPGSGDPTDASGLNGTWVTNLFDYQIEIKFNNGSSENFINGIQGTQGTYTTSGDQITGRVVRIHGDYLNFTLGMGLESKWYTNSIELKMALQAYMSEEAANEFVNEMFSPQTANYSISGNTLIITSDGETITYTRK